jgi:hypothetical protein
VAVYSHYVVVAVLALFALFALHPAVGRSRVSVRNWLAAHGAILASWLPWLAALALYWLASPHPRATLPHTATLDEVTGALVQFTSGSAALLQDVPLLRALGLVAGLGLLIAGWLVGREPERRGLRLLLALSAIIFFLPAVISMLTGRWLFVPHFMLFLLPALLVILGAGYAGHMAPGTPPVWRYAVRALLGAWVLSQLWGLVLFYRYPPHGVDGLRELAATLRTEAQPDDIVFVTPPALSPTLQQYYDGEIRGLPSDFDLRAVYLPYEPAEWNAESFARLQGLAAGRPRFWIVYRPELDRGGEFLAEVRDRHRLLKEQSYPYGSLYLFAAGGQNP